MNALFRYISLAVVASVGVSASAMPALSETIAQHGHEFAEVASQIYTEAQKPFSQKIGEYVISPVATVVKSGINSAKDVAVATPGMIKSGFGAAKSAVESVVNHETAASVANVVTSKLQSLWARVPSVKLSMPEFSMPKISMPKFTMPSINTESVKALFTSAKETVVNNPRTVAIAVAGTVAAVTGLTLAARHTFAKYNQARKKASSKTFFRPVNPTEAQ